jgi:hypothetical protein
VELPHDQSHGACFLHEGGGTGRAPPQAAVVMDWWVRWGVHCLLGVQGSSRTREVSEGTIERDGTACRCPSLRESPVATEEGAGRDALRFFFTVRRPYTLVRGPPTRENQRWCGPWSIWRQIEKCLLRSLSDATHGSDHMRLIPIDLDRATRSCRPWVTPVNPPKLK